MMKAIVVREIAALVLKPLPAHISAKASKDESSVKKHDHARYYGIITLNQVVLSSKTDADVAAKLIDVYFEIFNDVLRGSAEARSVPEKKPEKRKFDKRAPKKESRKAVSKAEHDEEGDSKLLAAVLTGVNRALPYAPSIKEQDNAARLDTLFKISHTSTFSVAIQALTLIYHFTLSDTGLPDRYYRVLYESLLDARLEASSKQTLFLNLLFKALKVDRSRSRTMAVVKRLLQVAHYQSSAFVVGSLYLVGQLIQLTPDLKRLLFQVPSAGWLAEMTAEDGGEESQAEAEARPEKKQPAQVYDGRKREPEFAGAAQSCLWELVRTFHESIQFELTPTREKVSLARHFQPAVAVHVREMLSEKPATIDPEIERYSLSSFLERYAYRNPKVAPSARGVSAMQPLAAGQDRGNRLIRGKLAGQEGPLNAERFWRQPGGRVPADQVCRSFPNLISRHRMAHTKAVWQIFVQRYYQNKNRSDQGRMAKISTPSKRAGNISDDSDGDDICDVVEQEDALSDFSNEEEADIWRAMRAAMPEAGDEDASDDANSQDAEEHPTLDGSLSEADEINQSSSRSSSADLVDEESVFGSDEEVVVDAMVTSKDSRGQDQPEDRPRKKRKLRNLPLFATAEDYAALISGSSG